MDGGVNLKGDGQLETDGYWVNNFSYRERSSELESQLMGLHP